jgi:hypothetical protein
VIEMTPSQKGAAAEGHATISLRVAPTRNNQARLVHWAKDYELESAIERYWDIRPTLPDLD